MIDYAAAGELLERYGAARRTFAGDDWVALFSDDAEYHVDPFAAPLVGHNALRAWLNGAAEAQRDVEFTVERHWVSGSTVLAAWHASWIGKVDGARARSAGFLTADVAPDGRIARCREWSVMAPTAV
ncbi:MAG TPA: nuclear transport factor 2 family protein [Candidatus Limnocylindrales bacterium]|jgi:ketosteroid isomerase-like protein